MEYIRRNDYFSTGLCFHFPSGYVQCENNFCCASCSMAARLREYTQKVRTDLPLFGYRDALPQTPKGGGENWYRMPVILSPAAMERLKIDPVLIDQIIVATDGPGVFKRNPSGAIDGYLFHDRTRLVTVSRSECFGIPTPGAAKKYDDYFFLGLLRYMKTDRKRGGVH